MSSLLAEIQAHPDDDALRAVYADERLAAGDPRGELITVELALAHATGDLAARLFARRAELRAAHAAAWWQLAPWQVHTRRGFATRVTLNRLAEPLPRWLADERVEGVQLLALRTTDLAAVLASPALAHVRRLSLVNAPATWLPALRGAPIADTLEALELWDCAAGPRRVPRFEAFPALRHLRCGGLVAMHDWIEWWRGHTRLATLERPGPRAAPADLARIDCVAPSGEHWRFEQVGAERWQVRVDGVAQPIVTYREHVPRPPAASAAIRETVTRLARDAGRASIGVGNAALTLTLHTADRSSRCTIAAGVGGPLRIFDPGAA